MSVPIALDADPPGLGVPSLLGPLVQYPQCVCPRLSFLTVLGSAGH